MQNAYQSNASSTPPTPPASFSVGYPQALPGAPATELGPWWFHAVTAELQAVIVDGGLTPSPLVLTQLRDAIRAAAPEDKGVLKKSISIGRKKLLPNGELGEAFWVGPSKKFHKYANTRFNRGSRTKRGKQRSAQVGKAYVSDGPAYYGKFLEYGSKHQAAHPWLRPAAEANAQRIVDTVNTELLARVDRLVKAIARANGVPK